MSSTKGKFIVFEGVDGSGTSTQTALLQRYILGKGARCILTAEPSPGPIGNLIREIHTERIFVTEDRQSRERELAYLFAADRHDHLYNDKNGIVRLIDQGANVISSRYSLSSYVYHTFSQNDLDFVKYLNKDFPLPDLLVYIDCPVEVSIQRISASRTPDLNEQRENLERVQKNFYSELEVYPGRKIVLDGTEDPEIVHRKIIEEVDSLLG